MNRVGVCEEQFKKRYNRDVEVYVVRETKDNKYVKARVTIISPLKTEYVIEEHFKDDQSTDFVIVEMGSKSHKYRSYLEGEISVADAIGEENG